MEDALVHLEDYRPLSLFRFSARTLSDCREGKIERNAASRVVSIESSVTAEAAGSSPVVPAIDSEELTGSAPFSRGQKRHK